MRARLFVAALAVALAGCPTPKCKDKTVLIAATFDAASSAADSLEIVVELDGNAQPAATIPGPHGHDSGTVQVEFPAGYHAGSTITVTVAAELGGQTVATGTASTTLMAGCTVLPLSVSAGGSGDIDMANPLDMLQLPNPVVASKPDLVGFITALDASGSSDPLGDTLAFKWAIQQAPTGSAITTSSLTSTTTAKTNFEPDRGGVYKIALTVTAPTDGRSATTVADVTVPTVPLFYSRASETALTSSLGAHVMASDGTGDHAIGCDFKADGGLSSSTLQAMPLYGHAYDPATAAATPLFVFFGFSDASMPPQLLVGSATTNCATSPPTRVDNNVFNDHIAVAARFSPDGKRIVYVDMPQDQSMGSFRLVTVASDGVGPKHVVRSSGFFGFTPAIWLDNSTVAWLEKDSSNFDPFTIFKAPDANAAGDSVAGGRMQVLRCDPATTSTHLGEINQFAISAFGMIVAGSTSPRSSLDTPPTSSVNLYKLADGDCSTTTAMTLAAEPRGGLSWDFTLSPDGLSILFSSTHNELIPDGGSPEPQTDIFLVPSDGSAAAQKIAGDPIYDDISPRFVAQGRQFVWTRTPRASDMGADVPAVMIANADGTHVHAFLSTAAAGETVRTTDVGASRGYDCSWIPGSAGSSATAALVALGALLLLALRPRRRR